MTYFAHRLLCVALLASLTILASCKSPGSSKTTVKATGETSQTTSTQDSETSTPAPQVDTEKVPPLWALEYPGSKEVFAGDLEITVIQDKKTLKLTNHTVTSYHNVQIWVNQRYVTRVADIPVGQTTSIWLKSLMNQYGEKYPTPGLFRPDRSFPALLVEMVQPDQNKRYRLIVQKTHSQF